MPATTRTDPYATYARALTLGVVTGLRSQTGLAAIALAAQPDGPFAALAQAPTPWRLIASQPGLLVSTLAYRRICRGQAPRSPPTAPGPCRCSGSSGFGALAGGACRALGQSQALGGALGVGALGGGFGYTYRVQVARLTGAPDLPLALAEDATAVIVALVATQA
ncbi:MAG: hypothetical protein U0232_26755 [Thermomicrobiales bacterium]